MTTFYSAGMIVNRLAVGSRIVWLFALAAGCAGNGDPQTTAMPSSDASAPAPSQAVAASSVVPSASFATTGSASAAQEPLEPAENDPRQHATLKAIAAGYHSFARADGTWWSPLDCRAPPDDVTRMSLAPVSNGAHGRKLYTLQIADFPSYANATGAKAASREEGHLAPPAKIPGVEQVVVKVSYEPTSNAKEAQGFGIAPAMHEGKTYYPGPQKDLFVMYRPTARGVETDAGWLYGTVSPDGRTVSSAGKVGRCMRCHEKAPHGRLFGFE